MSQTNSALMSIITQYTKQFVDRISELENENNQLKQKVDVAPTGLKADFDKLTERHSELKISYAEIERENTKLRQDMNQLIAQQDSLQSDIAKHFQQVFSGFATKQTEHVHTPRKSSNVKFSSVPPSQTPLYREAKATTKLLNTEYESDSSDSETDYEMPVPISDDESVNCAPRKLRFDVRAGQDPNKSFAQSQSQSQSPYSDSEPIKLNISEILHKDDDSSDEEDDNYETILKQIITEGLMSGLENMNRSPHNAARLNMARANSRSSKRNRPCSASKKHRPSMPHQQSRTAQTENENTNPFKFNFRFPQQPHVYGLNSNAQANTNQNQTHSQEAELVQKILESLFTPNK